MGIQKVFVPDSFSGMTTQQKNLQISAELAQAPNVDRKIIEIIRDTQGADGWWISFQAIQ